MENLYELNELLTEMKDEKQALIDEIEELKDGIEFKNWEWCKPIPIKRGDYRGGLPCPRVEINISGDRYRAAWTHGLVWNDYGEKAVNTFTPVGQTTTTGEEILISENPRLPWRGEFHLYWLARVFGLRIYLTRDSDKLIKELFINDDFIKSFESYDKLCAKRK